MPATSEAQQSAAAMALAAKRGRIDPKTLTGAARNMYQNMTEEQLEHYAREVKKVALEKVDHLSSPGLQLLHLRLHQLYSTRQSLREGVEDIVTAHRDAVLEIVRRGMTHSMHGLLDEAAEELDGELREGFEETENQIRYRVREPEDFRSDTFRTIQLEAEGVSSIVGKLKPDRAPEGHDSDSMVAQAFRFDKAAGWTEDKAQAWCKQHHALREEALTSGDLPAEATLGPKQEKVRNPQVEGLAKRATLGTVLEKREEERFTLSIAYPVNETDAHGETAEPEAVEKSAWWFMLNGRQSGVMHEEAENFTEAGDVVESYVYRGPDPWRIGDEEVNVGDWLVGIVWKPQYWEMIKRGEMTGVSIHGTAQREPLA